MTASAFAEGLSTSLHTPVKVAPKLASSLVFIAPNGSPSNVVLGSFAECLGASVVKTPEGILIDRSPTDLAKLKRHRRDIRKEWLRSRLHQVYDYRQRSLHAEPLSAALSRELRRQETRSQAFARGQTLNVTPERADQLLPEAVLLEGLIDRIGQDAIVATSSGHKLVFEDDPVLDAKPLPPHADLLAKYFEGKRGLATTPLSAESVAIAKHLGLGFVVKATQPTEDSVRLRLEVISSDSALDVELQVYNPDGNEMGRAWLEAGPEVPFATMRTLFDIETHRPQTHWLSLSPSALSVMEPHGAWPHWLLHPETDEPLNLFVSEVLTGLASGASSKCFAMNVTDSLWTVVINCQQRGQVNLDAVRRVMRGCCSYESLNENQSEIWRPMDVEAEDRRRVDRSILGRFARRAYPKGSLELSTVARFYRDCAPDTSSLTRTWSEQVQMQLNQASVERYLASATLKFMGAFPADVWSHPVIQQRIGDLGLTGALQKYLAANPPITSEANAPDIERHWQELFARADIADVTLTFQTEIQPVIQWAHPLAPKQPAWHPKETVADLFTLHGFDVEMGEHGPMLRMTQDRFEAGLSAKYEFRSGVASFLSLGLRLPHEHRVSVQGPPTYTEEATTWRYRDLPKRVRDSIWQEQSANALAEYNRMFPRVRPPEKPVDPPTPIPPRP